MIYFFYCLWPIRPYLSDWLIFLRKTFSWFCRCLAARWLYHVICPSFLFLMFKAFSNRQQPSFFYVFTLWIAHSPLPKFLTRTPWGLCLAAHWPRVVMVSLTLFKTPTLSPWLYFSSTDGTLLYSLPQLPFLCNPFNLFSFFCNQAHIWRGMGCCIFSSFFVALLASLWRLLYFVNPYNPLNVIWLPFYYERIDQNRYCFSDVFVAFNFGSECWGTNRLLHYGMGWLYFNRVFRMC